MIQFLVKFKSYQNVEDFVYKANSYDVDIDISVGHYMIDISENTKKIWNRNAGKLDEIWKFQFRMQG